MLTNKYLLSGLHFDTDNQGHGGPCDKTREGRFLPGGPCDKTLEYPVEQKYPYKEIGIHGQEIDVYSFLNGGFEVRRASIWKLPEERSERDSCLWPVM
jgi:hypothetical protein